MERMSRRGFVEAAGAAAAGAWMSPLPAAAAPDTPATDRTVYLAGDGIGLTPACLHGAAGRARRRRPRSTRTRTCSAARSSASSGIGRRCSARRRAVFMPSGTLANQLALRALAGTKRRVIVPETSHIYNDTGDACQTLSALTLLPLGARRGHLHAGRRRGRAGAHGERPGGHRRRRHRHREPGPAAVRADVRLGRADRRRGARPRARHRPPPRRRADVHRLGLHRPQPGRVRGALRHGLRVAVEVLQQRPGRDPRRAAPGARRHVPHPPDVRRQPGRGLAGGAGRAALHGRLRGAAARVPSRCPRRSIAPSPRHPRVAVERIPNGTNLARLTLKGVDPALATRRLAERGIRIADAVERRRGHARRQRDVDPHHGA